MNFKKSLLNKIILVVLILQPIIQASHKCSHDSELDYSKVNKLIEQTLLENKQKKPQNPTLRVLPSVEPRPIRITMDYSLFSQMTDSISEEQKQFLIKIMESVKVFFEKLLKVIPAQRPNKFLYEKCYEADIPEKYKTQGVSDSDLHIWVLYDNNPNSNTLANAIHCQMDDTLKRPNFGRVRVNMGHVGKDKSNSGYESNLSTIMHECIHIIGFSAGLYNYWVDPDTNDYYYNGDNTLSKVYVKRTIRGKETLLMKTKNVLETARRYYGCPNLEGMSIENDGGGSAGSHWEKTVLFNELMSPESSGSECQLSVFTLALLKDTGFYAEVNENLAQDIQWGKNKGCDFLLNACNSQNKFPEFERLSQFKGQCSYKNDGYGNIGASSFSDNCSILNNEVQCSNIQHKKEYSDQRLEYFGTTSKCLESTANDGKIDENYLDNTSRCHQVKCNSDASQITIILTQLNNKQIVCKRSDAGKNINIDPNNLQLGYVQCPENFRLFCSYTPECPNYCSQKGICIQQQCKCSKGWTGSDCSIPEQKCPMYMLEFDEKQCVQVCPQGTWANPDNICRSTCPRGYYQSKNQQCLQCDQTCQRCSGPSNKECLECQYLTFLENGVCVKQCSAGYQLIEKTCISSNNQGCEKDCEICDSKNKSQCTKCKGQTFLNLFTRKCVPYNQCPQDTFANQENNQCSICLINGCQQCQSQTVCAVCDSSIGFFKKGSQCVECPQKCEKCSEDMTCSQCKRGFYLNNGICVNSCPDGIFKNKEKRTCEQCKLEGCLQCYSLTECYQCDEKNKYQYDYKTKKCIKKDCNPPCDLCLPNNKSICTKCTGYLLLHQQQCITQCPQGFYQVNKQEQDYEVYICQKCPDGCLTCYDQENCQSCDSAKNYRYTNGKCILNECNQPCQKCLSNNKSYCTECSQGSYAYEGKCYTQQCPQGSYIDRVGLKLCLKCSDGCVVCINDKRCSQCSPDYNYDYDTEQCFKKDCETNCLKCNPNNKSECQVCLSGQMLMKNKCVQSCPLGYYPEYSTAKCVVCGDGCTNCPSAQECYECDINNGWVLQNQKCQKKGGNIRDNTQNGQNNNGNKQPGIKDPNNNGSNVSDNQCNPPCKACVNGSPSKCTKCDYPKFLHQNQCADFCPYGYYYNMEQFTCDKCSMQGCLSCSNAQVCHECDKQTGWTLQGTYEQGGKCIKQK